MSGCVHSVRLFCYPALSWLELATHLVTALSCCFQTDQAVILLRVKKDFLENHLQMLFFSWDVLLYISSSPNRKWKNNCTWSISSFPFINILFSFFCTWRMNCLIWCQITRGPSRCYQYLLIFTCRISGILKHTCISSMFSKCFFFLNMCTCTSDCLPRRILWGKVTKALLKSRKTTFMSSLHPLSGWSYHRRTSIHLYCL